MSGDAIAPGTCLYISPVWIVIALTLEQVACISLAMSNPSNPGRKAGQNKPSSGFSSEEARSSFDEESKHKLKPKHIDRQRERDQKALLEAFRSGDRELYAKVCDALGAVKGTAKREELEALFRKKHGYV